MDSKALSPPQFLPPCASSLQPHRQIFVNIHIKKKSHAPVRLKALLHPAVLELEQEARCGHAGGVSCFLGSCTPLLAPPGPAREDHTQQVVPATRQPDSQGLFLVPRTPPRRVGGADAA